jgi:hypothetical protein
MPPQPARHQQKAEHRQQVPDKPQTQPDSGIQVAPGTYPKSRDSLISAAADPRWR